MARPANSGKTVAVGALKPQPHGGALKHGNPGNNGGRPPDEFRKWCREVLHGKPTVDAVAALVTDHKHPAFIGAMKWLSSYGYGQPTEHHEITGKDGQPVQFVIVGGKKVGF